MRHSMKQKSFKPWARCIHQWECKFANLVGREQKPFAEICWSTRMRIASRGKRIFPFHTRNSPIGVPNLWPMSRESIALRRTDSVYRFPPLSFYHRLATWRPRSRRPHGRFWCGHICSDNSDCFCRSAGFSAVRSWILLPISADHVFFYSQRSRTTVVCGEVCLPLFILIFTPHSTPVVQAS